MHPRKVRHLLAFRLLAVAVTPGIVPGAVSTGDEGISDSEIRIRWEVLADDLENVDRLDKLREETLNAAALI